LTKKCTLCGFENTDDTTFCESCGSKIESIAPPPPPMPVPPNASAGSLPPRAVQPVTPPSMGGKMKCATCGAENETGTEFCDNCGARLGEAARVQAQPPGPRMPTARLILPQGDEIILTSYPRVFGRADFARLDKSEFISRKHFEVSYEGSKFYLTDTNSTNGTAINKTKVISRTELKDGDSIELGGTVAMTFRAG
jgi:DNA-directed RNA polymerase subunit RPC12/RpoP